MFEIKNLKKSYKTKNVVVQAVNDVSLKIQDKGMIFLMGKSGSGKSTMLNLIGGLDKYDSGDIIFKGVSTKDFKQRDFDSFRNAYVGFVFQEYNLLNEFSVGANIGLSLELQGKKFNDDDINKMLHDVDLDGYGHRKISELSGGQKQRVAIARALVKNPEVILADEPTGALDSNSGENVLDILKKLSKDKLVFVVSHDREFAEKYGDRIIELADGKVISDVTCKGLPLPERNIKEYLFEKYHMSLEDRELINQIVKDSSNLYINDSFKQTTDEDIKNSNDQNFKPIKSKLSFKNASTIARSSLKHKKFKLAITIFLSVVALSMFAFFSLVNHYDYKNAFIETLNRGDYKYISFTKAYEEINGNNRFYDEAVRFKQRDLEKVSNTLDSNVYPMIYFGYGNAFDVFSNINNRSNFKGLSYLEQLTYSYTLSVIDQGIMDEYNIELIAGRLPENKYEITINEFAYNYYKTCGYINYSDYSEKSIENYEDIIGLELDDIWNGTALKVVGIAKTNFDLDKYLNSSGDKTFSITEFYEDLSADYANSMFINIDTMNYLINRADFNNTYQTCFEIGDNSIDIYSWVIFNEDTDDNVVFFDENKTSLQDNEIIVPLDFTYYVNGDGFYDYDEEIAYLRNNFSNKEVTIASYPNDEDPIYINVKIVGYSLNNSSQSIITTENTISNFSNIEHIGYGVLYSSVTNDKYEELYSLLNENQENEKFNVYDATLLQLSEINFTLKSLSKYIFYLSLFLAAFAGLLLSSYISTSISYKKRDIGILRAIGARQTDVLKIFFTESIYIALINFALSFISTILILIGIDRIITVDLGINVSVITFNLLTIIELFALTMLVSFLGSFIPVKNIASKKPIEAIRSE